MTPGSTCDIHSLESSSSSSSIIVSTDREELWNIMHQAGILELELSPCGAPLPVPASVSMHLCSCPSRLRLDTAQALCSPDNFNAVSFI